MTKNSVRNTLECSWHLVQNTLECSWHIKSPAPPKYHVRHTLECSWRDERWMESYETLEEASVRKRHLEQRGDDVEAGFGVYQYVEHDVTRMLDWIADVANATIAEQMVTLFNSVEEE